jgi:hypothetical protein
MRFAALPASPASDEPAQAPSDEAAQPQPCGALAPAVQQIEEAA